MILFLLLTFYFAPLVHPLNLNFRRNSGWEVSQPFSQIFAAELQIVGLFDIILSPLASFHGLRLISYYYCPGKSYTLRRKDILTFITIFCDLKCFPPCFLSKMLFSHCIGFTWMFQLLSPLQCFHCQLHHFETYFPFEDNYMSSFVSWYCLCKTDLQITPTSSESC